MKSHQTHIGELNPGIDRTGRACLAKLMEKGFNSDLTVGNEILHIQTEDWGFENPYLVTRVFRSGAVIESVKTPYSDVLRHRNAFLLLRNKVAMSEALVEAMRLQHDKILAALSAPR